MKYVASKNGYILNCVCVVDIHVKYHQHRFTDYSVKTLQSDKRSLGSENWKVDQSMWCTRIPGVKHYDYQS